MAPVGIRCSCIVCGQSLKKKKTNPLEDHDSFWNQHADEIRTGSKGSLKEFLKYFGVSLTSVAAYVRDGDVDQVLEELTVCSDCNDWVLYGAFLKEKYLRVDRVLRNKIQNAFTSDRFDSRLRSSSGTVVEQLRQCLMPCFVRVDKIAAPDQHLGVTPSEKGTTNGSIPPLPLAKRRKTPTADRQDPLLSAAVESDVGNTEADNIDYEKDSVNSGVDDTAMDYDDHSHVTNAVGDDVGHLQDTNADPKSNPIMSMMTAQGLDRNPPSGVLHKTQKRKRLTGVVANRKCPICQIDVADYIKHMVKNHHVQPHHVLSNNFWCFGCKMAYQPPNPETPTGQYIPQDHDIFLQFVRTHSACPKSYNVLPHPCRFCGSISRHQARPAFHIMEHEAKFHEYRFGDDHAWAVEVKQSKTLRAWQRRLARKARKRAQKENNGTVVDPPSPPLMINVLKKEVSPVREDPLEDSLMMEHFFDNLEDAGCSSNQAVDGNTVQCSISAAPGETGLSQVQQPETQGFEPETSTTRRSNRATKPTVQVHDLNICSSEENGEDPIGSNDVADLETYESEESELNSEAESEDSNFEISRKKNTKSKRARVRTFKLKSRKKPATVSDDDDNDDDSPADDSEKLPCVLCDVQRSRPKLLQKHYRVKHNLMTPREGYFGCNDCQHAFLSPNDKIPTGKLVPEDFEYLKEFVNDHEICRNLHVTKSSNYLSSLHFCRYCYKRFQNRTSFTDCIKHELESHGDEVTEIRSIQETPLVFLFYCVHCKFKTKSLDDLYKQMRTHRKQHKYGCCRCDAQFKDVRELTYHIRLHGTSNDVFEACLLCDASTDAPSIVGHYRLVHGLEVVNYKYFGCWSCDEAFNSEQPGRPSGTVFGDDLENLRQFAVKHANCETAIRHPSKQQKCRECPNTFTTMRQLVEHEEFKHQSVDHRFVAENCCDSCGKTFLFEESLQKHMALHLPKEYGFKGAVPFYDCPDCYYSFSTNFKTVYDRHILMHKPDKSLKDQQMLQMTLSQFLDNRKVNYRLSRIELCYLCGSKVDPATTIFEHYSRLHNIGVVSNQMYCFGCKEPFVLKSNGAPIEMDIATDEMIQKFKNFAARHVECRKGRGKPNEYCSRCSKFKTIVHVGTALNHFLQVHLTDFRIPFPKLDCLRCGEDFKSILQLREHLESEGISNPAPHLTFRTGGLNCLSCVKCFDTVAEFSIHFKYFHNNNSDKEVKFECSVCHKVLESAIGSGNEEFPQSCADHETECKAKAREEGSKKCEDFAWPDLTCFICQETFDSIQRYSVHINEHSGHAVEGLCPICPAVFAEQEELKKHVKLHGLHSFAGWPDYYRCGRKSCLWVSCRPEVESGRLIPDDLSEFQTFAERHLNCPGPPVTAYGCRFCNAKFSVGKSFVHEVNHTKRYQVYCEECGRGFSSQLRLNYHARQHEDKLRISCNLCPRKFRQRSYLEQHMNTHAGLKPFVCHQCGKCFSMANRLREHVQCVHNKPKEKTFPCTSGCDRMFATRRDARVHEKQAHNRPTETRTSNQFRNFGE